MSVATQDAPRAPKSMLQSDNTSSLRRGTVAAGSSSSSSRRGESAERSSVKGPHPSSEKGKNSLAKVPCKFFRAGACTNTDCPFLHQEQGTPKQICPWYQSNNCKFGSSECPWVLSLLAQSADSICWQLECALAHVLPGQPMSMDRKNKRAQQLAQREADAQTTNSPTSPPITPEKTPSKSSEPFSSAPHEPLQVTKRQAGFLPLPAQPATAAIHSESIMAANPTSGATAAVNAKSVWGPNMNPAIKQAPSQSNGPSRQVGFAPASATTASENSEVSSTYASKASTTLSPASSSSPDLHTQQQQANVALGQSPRGLIMDYMLSGQRNTASSPRQPELFAGAADFRPSVSPALRSPPPTTAWPTSVAPASTQRHASGALDMPQSMPTNGTHAFGTSPFSNPGQRSIFLQPSSFGSDDNHLELMFDSKNSKESTPHKAADPWMKGGWDKPASFGGFRATRSSTSSAAQEVLDSFEDEEDEERIEEDFLPSSLHDLLTPEELQRAHRNQQQQQQQQQSHNKLAPQQHHNSLFDISLSRSVPADQAWKQPNGGHDGGAQMDFTVEQQQPAKGERCNVIGSARMLTAFFEQMTLSTFPTERLQHVATRCSRMPQGLHFPQAWHQACLAYIFSLRKLHEQTMCPQLPALLGTACHPPHPADHWQRHKGPDALPMAAPPQRPICLLAVL